jgi:hypothetical protein
MLPGSRITSEYSEGGRAVHVGKGVTVGRSLHRKRGPDKQGWSTQANLLAGASLLQTSGMAEASRIEEPGAVVPHAGICGRCRITDIPTATL